MTTPLRRLPEILVVGSMRSGSSSLFEFLADHPDVAKPSRKEMHFFDLNFHRGENWYRAYFPVRRSALTVDASPSYLVHTRAADRAHQTVPDARVIALLRDPVARAWSHFRLRRAKGTEKRTFHDLVEEEANGETNALCAFGHVSDISIVGAGLYAAQLWPWFNEFGRDRVLVVKAEQLFGDDSTLLRVQEFVGLAPTEVRLHRLNIAPAHTDDHADDHATARLREFYRPSNEELFSLIGRDFGW